MTNESGSPDDELPSSMQPSDQNRHEEDPQDRQHRCACIEEAYAKSHYAPTPDQEDALKKLAAGEGKPLELAKVLRPSADLLEVWPGLPDNDLVRTVRGLVQLSNPDAFAVAESGRLSIDLAAFVGHYARDVFTHHHPPHVSEDFQLRAITRLAGGEPVSAVDKVANDILNERREERRRLDCERIESEPYWSIWSVLSWVAFRDVARLCELADENSLRRLSLYGVKHYGPTLKEAKPGKVLLVALRNDDLRAIRDGAEVAPLYWSDLNKYGIDRNVVFRKRSVRRCWPGPGEWNGFEDEFWSLGQMILWIITGDPDDVDQASDDAGRVGTRSGYGGFAAAVKLAEFLREDRGQVQDVANGLRRLCLRGDLKALSGEEPIPKHAWIDLTIGFEAEGVPVVRRLSQRTLDPAYNNVRFSRVDALNVFPRTRTPAELNLSREARTRRVNDFNRKQACIALGKRRWLRLTEIADEYARKRGSLAIDAEQRRQALDALRYSILTGELVDKQGRSRVLNMHPSPLATLRFDPLGASNPERFDWIAADLWITHRDCVDWFKRHRLEQPHRLRLDQPSMAMPDAPCVEAGRRTLADKARPAKKSDHDKKADALEIARTFVVDGVADSVKEHATKTMAELKNRYPQNHIRREDLERLLEKEFVAQRRPVGRQSNKQ